MSAGGGGEQQIIIVRRRYDEEEGHHGGVWKIAFADFMTAMMCFFLVMWLINATDDRVKVSLASYFNPIKLVDSTSGRQGLNDPGKETTQSSDADTTGPASGGPAQEKSASELSESVEHSDSHLFADPYAVLAEIAAETGTMQNISTRGDGGAQDAGPATGASGGEAYRDPFAPDFWTQNVAPGESMEEASSQAVALAEQSSQPGEDPVSAELSPSDAAEDASAGQAQKVSDAQPEEAVNASEDAQPATESSSAQELAPSPPPAAERIAEEIKQELAAAFDANDKLYKGLSITPTEHGVRLSVTDQLDFGMFEIGSAVPRRDLVLAMDKIGAALKDRPGRISIQGHTDARPFKSETYDNWRLSTARAHSAYHMLVRGGVDERRIVEVAGFADRQLMNPEDPFAAVNRRIEIFLDIDE